MVKNFKTAKLWALLLYFMSSGIQADSSRVIKVIVPSGFLSSLKGMVVDSPALLDGRDYDLPVDKCIPISQIKAFNFGRPVLDFLIHCQVIRLNKLADTIKVIQAPNNLRAMKMVAAGDGDVFAMSEFSSVVKNLNESNLLVSAAVLREGEFEVGLFTAPNRQDVLAVTNVNELMDLTSISTTSWSSGASSMTKITSNPPVLVSNYRNIPEMIAKKRADFTTHSLSKKFIYDLDGKVSLQRIEGFKLSLPGERVFVVNSASGEYFQALQDFISSQRDWAKSDEDGILKAFEDIGWISSKYKDWILINDYFYEGNVN
ncbi:hypothetical protein [Paraglaciecola sp. 2405UD69-4]|uniref:hypothetical protein n=1 Tax=Paraglaciecola sp. 2405UD69-4 TaxID=3391836 RepID=UPI0039C94087